MRDQGFGDIHISTTSSQIFDSWHKSVVNVTWIGAPLARVGGYPWHLFCQEQGIEGYQVGTVFLLGDYLAEIVDYDPLDRSSVLARVGSASILYRIRYRLCRQWWPALSLKLVVTASIWCVVDWPEQGERYHWGLIGRRWQRYWRQWRKTHDEK